MILKTIHEYFNHIWLEHSKNNIYGSLSPAYKLRQSSIKSNLIQDMLASDSTKNYMLVFKRKRSRRKPFKRLARSRRAYNKINNNFKLSSVTLKLKRQLLLRFRIKNINPVRAFYFNLSSNSSNLFKSKVRISRNFILRRKRYKFFRKSKKKRVFLLRSKALRNQNILTKKKKLRLFNIKKRKILITNKAFATNRPNLRVKLNSLYLYSKSSSQRGVATKQIFPTNSTPKFFTRKYKRLRKYLKLKKRKLKIKVLYPRSSSVNYFKSKAPSSSVTPHYVIPQYEFKSPSNYEKPRFSLSKLSLRISNVIGATRLSYLSLFLRYRLTILNLRFKSEKFLVKKLLFSFLKPNEAKKSIMNRRKKIQVSRLFKKIKKSKVVNSMIVNPKANLALKSDKKYTPSNNSYLKSPLKKLNYSYELFLPRVKFKPGYQRLWRRSRKAMADNIGLRYIYQKQMTKYMLRLSRRVYSYNFSMSESSVDKAILYSRLLPDLKTINEFLSSGLISLNGWQINNLNSFVIQGDFIQLTISKWLSIYFRWLVTWAKVNKAKFRNLVFRKGLASSYKLMKQRKQRSQYVPLWVYNSRFDISDIKPNFEVDYFTMSSIVLYEPLLIDYYTPDDLPDHRHYIYRLYNWKYIT